MMPPIFVERAEGDVENRGIARSWMGEDHAVEALLKHEGNLRGSHRRVVHDRT